MTSSAPDPIDSFVDEQSNKIARWYRSSGVPYADAEDLVQQAFEVYFGKDESTITSPYSFLWSIARKKLLKYRERTRHHDEFRSSRILPQITSPSQRLDRRLRVQMLLQRLDDEEGMVFLMRCEGLKLPAIAD